MSSKTARIPRAEEARDKCPLTLCCVQHAASISLGHVLIALKSLLQL